MPLVLRIDRYCVFFWANEGTPSEPIHVHVSEGRLVPNATKIWISQTGRCREMDGMLWGDTVLLLRLIRNSSLAMMSCCSLYDAVNDFFALTVRIFVSSTVNIFFPNRPSSLHSATKSLKTSLIALRFFLRKPAVVLKYSFSKSDHPNRLVATGNPVSCTFAKTSCRSLTLKCFATRSHSQDATLNYC